MLRNKAILIDPHAKGSYHEVINASYLYVIAQNYKEVTYITHKSAYDNALKILHQYGYPLTNVKLKHIERRDYSGKKHRGIKYLLFHYECSNLDLKYYNESEEGTDVFYNNNILLGLNRLNKAVEQKGNRVFIMCHSEMNMLEKKRPLLTRPEVITRHFLQKFLSHKINEKITMFVLGDWICKRVQTHALEDNSQRIKSYDHLYFRNTTVTNQNVTLPGLRDFKIGIPSLINEGRGLGKLIELLKSSNDNRKFDIYAIGRVVTERDLCGVDLIRLNDSNQLLSTEQYLAYTQSMDAMIFFVGENFFGASGGVLEAIWNEKIILTLRNAYAEYVFEKFGPMGMIFDDVEAMSHFLNNNIDELIDKQSIYKENIKRAKDFLRPENNIKSFAEFIE
jgi:hypothetical protein